MVLRVRIFVILLLVWYLVCVVFLALPLSWRSWVFGVFTSLPCSFSHPCNYLDWAHLCLVTPVVPQTFLGVFPHVSLVLRLISCYSWAVLFVTSKFSLKIFFSDLSVILSPIHKHVLTIVTKECARFHFTDCFFSEGVTQSNQLLQDLIASKTCRLFFFASDCKWEIRHK